MECPHCVETYLWWFPITPFAAAGALLGVGDWGWVVAACVIGTAWLGGIALLARRARWWWLAIGGTASALASAALSLAFAGMLRM